MFTIDTVIRHYKLRSVYYNELAQTAKSFSEGDAFCLKAERAIKEAEYWQKYKDNM